MVKRGNLDVSMNGQRLEQLDGTKILGLQLSTNPSNAECMVTQQAGKMKSGLRMVQNASRYVTPTITKMLCNAFVRPHATFCVAAWGPNTTAAQRHRLDSLLVRSAKLVWGNYGLSRTEYIATMDWLGTKSQSDYEISCSAFKSIKGQGPKYLQNKFREGASNTRSATAGSLRIPRANIDAFKGSFSYRGAELWNSLPTEVRDAETFGSFKSRAFKYFKDKDEIY
jgi:hypothetical protein